MNVMDAEVFAQQWAEAWNAHDLDAVLAHFTEDAVFTSPLAAAIMPESRGVLRGKNAIDAYWRLGLEKIPDLHFTVIHVYTGLETVVINYSNQAGNLVNEVLHLNEHGLIDRGDGTYLQRDVSTATGAHR